MTIMTLLQHTNLDTILMMIYCFVDDFLKGVVQTIRPALTRPTYHRPPTKKHNLSIAELASLAIFRFFTGHTDWKSFHAHLKTYHLRDFPKLPCYKNFLVAVNALTPLSSILLSGFMHVFRSVTRDSDPKFTDGSKLRVCHIKREFSHKVCEGLATKSKSSMGWFYGFRLHIICNELMQILKLRITTATTDERKALAMMWDNIFGMIIADAGYVGKNWQDKAHKLGKHLMTGVRANMKKIMTHAQFQLLKLRQRVETVFSVLKLRMGMETTLPRSPLGYAAHYLWCLTAYQLKKFFEYAFPKPLLA
jgi:transposase